VSCSRVIAQVLGLQFGVVPGEINGIGPEADADVRVVKLRFCDAGRSPKGDGMRDPSDLMISEGSD
jgi:hypothetical protein